MTETALRLLVDNETCPEAKIRVVPHGAPTLLVERAAHGRGGRTVAHERLQDRFVLSTFGLLSSGKGIENVLEALPAIVERASRDAVCRRRTDASRRRSARGRAVPPVAPTARGRTRARGARRVRRSLPRDRRDRRPAGDDVGVRDAVPRSGPGLFRRADLRDRRRLRRRLDAVSLRRGHARKRRRRARAVRRPGRGERGRLPLHRRPGPARRRPRRGAAHRRGRELALGRHGNRRGAARRDGAHPAPRICRQPRAAPRQLPPRPPADDGRRRRDRAARARGDPEPTKRLLRRRRRAARGRGARARAPV